MKTQHNLTEFEIILGTALKLGLSPETVEDMYAQKAVNHGEDEEAGRILFRYQLAHTDIAAVEDIFAEIDKQPQFPDLD